ncbi:DUF5694 domain-containing protein [Lutimonas vermicola]|uniref:DUF5694 domain-containing protein n=1 Tax=Lutimonas vermicola TaxID=414288 RepID=A0ABU9L572_9FLAO
MKRYIIVILLLHSYSILKAQEVEVLTLGTFHFAFHNRDVQKTDKKDQIDVLKPEYQNEIETIVSMIARFEPTIIAIEIDPDKQSKIDSLYKAYLTGKHMLERSETEQIGFRLAKQFRLKTLYCVNDWGKLPDEIQQVVYGNDTIAKQKFMNFFYNNPDSLLIYEDDNLFKSEGILAELRNRNSEEFLKHDLGNYLISIFKYETDDNEFFGVDFTTGWWYNRNLRIFRNIQKIPTKPNDKILVIYGSGHMNMLNTLFEVSPEYRLVRANDYLK